MIDLVVFDMAGTTVHDGDAVNASFRAALAAAGVQADPAVVNTVMGLHKPEAIRILLDGAGQSTAAAHVAAIHDDYEETDGTNGSRGNVHGPCSGSQQWKTRTEHLAGRKSQPRTRRYLSQKRNARPTWRWSRRLARHMAAAAQRRRYAA